MRNTTLMFTFLVFDREYPFWANLVQKLNLSASAGIWYLYEIEYTECTGDIFLFCFLTENTLFGKFGPKIQNCSKSNLIFRLIRTCKTKWWCVNSICFRPEILFSSKFSPKNQNCHFKVK